jgi:Leucine-rich repeat (LRR) protein
MFRSLLLAFTVLSINVWSQNTIYTDLDQITDPSQVKHLELRKMKLSSIPSEVFKLSNLEYLDLSKNRIEKIPIEIKDLTHLKTLVLSKNKIIQISPLTGLKNLEELHLDRNPIEKLPSEISNLEKLLVFDCWQCYLDELPIEMKQLQSLIEIDIRQTYIRQQDAGIYYEWWPNAKVLTTWGCNCGQ